MMTDGNNPERTTKRRYSVEEMLAGCDFTIPLSPEAQAEEDAWQNMPSVGREFGSPGCFAEHERDSEEGKRARAQLKKLRL